jgi:glycosyltransferase involved in cell wall biosynthesis
MKEKEPSPLLSVVIIGLNEAENIGRCIDKIKIAVKDFPDTEIAYVDSGSSDNTVAISLSKGVRVFQLGKIQPPSPSAGRYVGSLVTSGRFIMFVDADTMIAPGWIKPAIELMMLDPSVALFSGTHCTDPSVVLDEVKGLGVIKPVCKLSGSWAPIASRQILEKAGNWNPFVRCREEECLAIRIRHYAPGSKILRGGQCTVFTPKCSVIHLSEFFRRWKIGFIKGPGQIIRNGLAHGYWKRCWKLANQIIPALALLIGLAIGIAMNFWWQFLLLFFGLIFLRAVVTLKLVRATGVFYNLFMGFCSLWELLVVPPRTAADYQRDFREITSADTAKSDSDHTG